MRDHWSVKCTKSKKWKNVDSLWHSCISQIKLGTDTVNMLYFPNDFEIELNL